MSKLSLGQEMVGFDSQEPHKVVQVKSNMANLINFLDGLIKLEEKNDPVNKKKISSIKAAQADVLTACNSVVKAINL